MTLALTINGEPRTITDAGTVEELLSQLHLDPRAVVVEVNRKIIRRAAIAVTPVADGDVVEIVHFVGGG
jgi:thiamine biosynthesis protein ThiS